jgi:hypothetical protein
LEYGAPGAQRYEVWEWRGSGPSTRVYGGPDARASRILVHRNVGGIQQYTVDVYYSDGYKGITQWLVVEDPPAALPPVPPTTVASAVGAGKALSLWNGSGNNPPPADWQTRGFNDSGWGATAAGNTVGPYISGAAPVWAAGGLAAPGQAILVRHEFTLASGSVTSASITVAADDLVDEVYINGTFIGVGARPTDPGWAGHDTPKTLPVPATVLLAGQTNLIAISARDTGGGYDVKYRLDVNR